MTRAHANKPQRKIYQGAGYAIAAGLEYLIAHGHPPDAVWRYTPRQIAAWCVIAQLRRRQELGEQLSLNALAAQGTEKAIKEQIRDWSK